MIRMPRLMLFIANMVSRCTPFTRLFALRAAVFRGAGVRIAGSAKICGHVIIHSPNVYIGNESWIGANTELVSTVDASIEIGRNCDISQQVLLVCGSHSPGGPSRRAGQGASKPIRIGDGTWVGARAVFLGGSSVGLGCIVGAGSLVRGSFGDNLLIAGSPAKVLRRLDGPE